MYEFPIIKKFTLYDENIITIETNNTTLINYKFI